MTDGKNLISAHKRYSNHPCLTCSPGAIKHCGVSPLQAESHRGPPSPVTGLRHHRCHMPEACWRWRRQSPARARLSPRPTPRREAPTSLLAGAAPTGGAAYRPADAFAHRGLGTNPHIRGGTQMGGLAMGKCPKPAGNREVALCLIEHRDRLRFNKSHSMVRVCVPWIWPSEWSTMPSKSARDDCLVPNNILRY